MNILVPWTSENFLADLGTVILSWKAAIPLVRSTTVIELTFGFFFNHVISPTIRRIFT